MEKTADVRDVEVDRRFGLSRRVRLTDRAIELSKVQEADMPSFRAADTPADRLFTDFALFHHVYYTLSYANSV